MIYQLLIGAVVVVGVLMEVDHTGVISGKVRSAATARDHAKKRSSSHRIH